MAISLRASGSWVAANATTQTVTLPTHAAGDMLIVRVAFKHATMPTTVTCGTAGWNKLGQYNNGTTVSGNGTGSVIVAVFYKEATSAAETNPVITYHASVAATPSAAVALSYQKGATEAWLTPVGDGGPVGTGTAISSTIQSHISTTAGDMVDFFYSQGDNNTLTVPNVTQAGVTFGTVSEQPAAALSSATSNDIDADGGYRLASSGTSSAAAVVTGTATAGDQGSAWTTRLRVATVTTYSGSFTADSWVKGILAGSFTANAFIKNTIYGSGGGVVFIQDGFSGTGNLNSRTPDTVDNGSVWASGTTTTISGGLAFCATGLAGTPTLATTVSDLELSTDTITLSNDARHSIVFRRSDASNYWRLSAFQGATGSEDNWFLTKVVGGTPTDVLTGPGNIAVYALRVIATGSQIYVYINGASTPTASTTDSFNSSATTIGLDNDALSAAGNISFDNFIAKTAGVNTTFTADAWIAAQAATTYNGSFTADAHIASTVSGTFSANAIISKTDIPGSFSANAHIKKADISGSFTVDAWIGKTTSQTFTADAHIKRVDIPGTFTANSIIRKVDIPGSFTANAHILRTFSGSLTADAHILRTFSGSLTADSWVRGILSGSVTANAHIRKTDITGSVTADAFVRRLDIAQSITADAFVKRVDLAGSFTANAMVQRTYSGSFTVDAWIAEAGATTYTGNFTADAWVKGTPTGAFTADANIAATVARTFTADAFVLRTTSGTFSANAMVLRAYSGSLTANAYVRRLDIAGSVTANAYIRREFSGSLTANAHILKTTAGTFTANANIANTVSGSFTADAWIVTLGTVLGSFTADSIIRRLDIPGSFTANAFIQRTFSGSLTADAWVRGVRPGSFTADAYVRGTLTGSLTADAYVRNTITGTVTADAYVRSTLAGQFTADSWVIATLEGSFVANAIIYNPNAVKAVVGEVATLRTYGVRLSVGITLEGTSEVSESFAAELSTHGPLSGEVSVGRSLVGRTEKL